MEHSSERKLQLWDEISRANEVRTKDDRRHWRRTFLVYVGVIVATVSIATALAKLPR
jgi:hypothetical protein